MIAGTKPKLHDKPQINQKIDGHNIEKQKLLGLLIHVFMSQACYLDGLLFPQIEEKAMVPAKEAKEILYNMFAQNFVSITVSIYIKFAIAILHVYL